MILDTVIMLMVLPVAFFVNLIVQFLADFVWGVIKWGWG